MTHQKTITAADLFCGAGGSSTGLTQACSRLGYHLDLTAINHWSTAIETHSTNHPRARHLCESLDSVDPRKLYPAGRLDLLMASPECTHFSVARGGKPCSDQSRSSAWHILRWAEALYIDNIIVENVKEFTSWGPLGANGRPLKTQTGQTFQAFLTALRSLGYNAEWRTLNAADYGDPTTRERFFLVASRGRRKIQWPTPTHAHYAQTQTSLFADLQPWRPARDIIDFTCPSASIFSRARPLAPATLRRIEIGLRQFAGKHAEPFLVIRRNHAGTRSLSDPLPTLTAGGQHIALCEPFLVEYYGTGTARPVSSPIGTLTTHARYALVTPDLANLDIRFRMLQPAELARAMGFLPDYRFSGTRTEQVKQIGNAVAVGVSTALCTQTLQALRS